MSACLERRSLFGGFNFENYRDYDRQGQFLKGLVEGSPRGDWRKFAGSMNDRICLQGLRAARERLERKEGSSFLRYFESGQFSLLRMMIGSYGDYIILEFYFFRIIDVRG